MSFGEILDLDGPSGMSIELVDQNNLFQMTGPLDQNCWADWLIMTQIILGMLKLHKKTKIRT